MTTTRTRIPRAVRYQVLRRDNHACRYCGATAPDAKIVVDHVTPIALGGTNDPGNLVAACQPCNAGKAAMPPDAALVADVSADALRWSRARNLAIEMARAEERHRDAEIIEMIGYWRHLFLDSWGYTEEEAGMVNAGCDLYPGIGMWLDQGLTVDDMLYLTKNEVVRRLDWLHEKGIPFWKYFAGCCWKRIRKIDDLAQEIVQSERAG